MRENINAKEGFADEYLVDQAKNGNLEAFTELVRRYQKRIYKTVFHLTKNHLDADDLVQDTFMKAFKSLKKFRKKSSFYTWIYKIAVNLTFNFLKKQRREENRESFTENYSPSWKGSPHVSSPEDYSLKKELREKVKYSVDSLPLDYKSSFILVDLQGMSHSQAGEVLGCSEKTISWRMHKARKILQQKLKTYV